METKEQKIERLNKYLLRIQKYIETRLQNIEQYEEADLDDLKIKKRELEQELKELENGTNKI